MDGFTIFCIEPQTSQPNEDAKRTNLRKTTSLRRLSDQNPSSAIEQPKPKVVGTQLSIPVPSLLPTIDFGKIGIPGNEISADLMAYANQLNSYFASLPPLVSDPKITKSIPSQTLSANQTSSKLNSSSNQNLPAVKRDKSQISNVPNLTSFNSKESLPSVNQLISNVSRAIAASFSSNQSSEDKRSTVHPQVTERVSNNDVNKYVENRKNRTPSNSKSACHPIQAAQYDGNVNSQVKSWTQTVTNSFKQVSRMSLRVY